MVFGVEEEVVGGCFWKLGRILIELEGKESDKKVGGVWCFGVILFIFYRRSNRLMILYFLELRG